MSGRTCLEFHEYLFMCCQLRTVLDALGDSYGGVGEMKERKMS